MDIEKLLDEALEKTKAGEHPVVELVSEPGSGKTKKVLAWANEKGVEIFRLSVEMYALIEKLDTENALDYFVSLGKPTSVLFLDDVEKMPAKIYSMINHGNIGLGNFLFTVKAETKR